MITLSITLQAGAASLLGVAPSNLPTASPGQSFIVALTGNGFVPASDSTQPTTVGIVSGGILVPDVNLAATVLNSSNMIVTLTVPSSADPLLPFAAAGGTVTLGVCNPSATACTVPTGTAKLLLTPYPVIQAVTSAASFLQTAPPALPLVAPYDMISLFGASFCISGGTGCRDGQVLYGTPDPATLRYPLSLSPDVPGSAQRLLTVVFQTHATPPVAIAAPLLFATNGQINLLVPAAVSTYVGKSIDIVVNFGPPLQSAVLSSAPFPVRVAAADPALFTIGTDGQGDGAILGQDWSIIGSGNEAAMRAVPADSDIVQIYMTGLGAPDSAANNSAAGAGQWPADCVTPASYLAALNLQMGAGLTTLDGVLLAGSLLNTNRLPPCLSSAAAIPSVTIGGQPATVTYAGWVNGFRGGPVSGECQAARHCRRTLRFIHGRAIAHTAHHRGPASRLSHRSRHCQPTGRHHMGRAALEVDRSVRAAGCGRRSLAGVRQRRKGHRRRPRLSLRGPKWRAACRPDARPGQRSHLRNSHNICSRDVPHNGRRHGFRSQPDYRQHHLHPARQLTPTASYLPA